MLVATESLDCSLSPCRAVGGRARRRFAAGVLWSGAGIKRGDGCGTRGSLLVGNQVKQSGRALADDIRLIIGSPKLPIPEGLARGRIPR